MSRSSARTAGNIGEIASDPALRIYGALLTLTHVFSFFVWRRIDLPELLASHQGLCWPFWEDCQKFRVFSPGQIQAALWIYLALAALGVLLFLKKKGTPPASWLLLGLSLFKILIISQDFQLRLNQHYMIAFSSLAFLFFPRKREVLPLLVAFFYFWAGVLKLDPEWLSGSALYEQPSLVGRRL